jgi:hypothetical protein
MPGITLTVSGKADQALTNRLAREIIDSPAGCSRSRTIEPG